MGSTINDGVTTQLAAYSGANNDRIMQWLRFNLPTATAGASLNDLWLQFCNALGFTSGTTQERIAAYMKYVVGYGAPTDYNDLQYAYWNGGAANIYPYLFNFNAQLQALPAALQALNAQYTRNSLKNVVQDGALVQLAANQFGTSYDSVTGLYGYDAEPAATNLLTYSSQYDHANWASKTNFSVTPDATVAPDGTTTGDLITSATSSASYCSQVITVSNATVYTESFFLKAGNSRYIFFGANTAAVDKYGILDTATGTITGLGAGTTATTPIALNNGWYRCSITFTTAATSLSGNFARGCAGATDITPVAGGTCYIWGAQLETGSRATSYIATGAATASRAADVLSVPVANIPGFSSAAYTLFADGRQDTAAALGQRTIVSINDASTNNLGMLYVSGATTQPIALVKSAGATQSTQAGSVVTTSRVKLAVSMQLNSIKASFNGTADVEDLSANMPASPTTLSIGLEVSAAQFNGFIFRAGLVPAALTQAQINGMTS